MTTERGADAPHRPRLLFFTFDGEGLGHLKRICLIAEGLQDTCSCLIVSGHRTMSELVSTGCEYVHLPSYETLFEHVSRHWDRAPFMRVSKTEALKLRATILDSIVAAFRPDAIFTDCLPLGLDDELEAVIRAHRGKSYLILRGVLGDPEKVSALTFSGKQGSILETHYRRLLVASDRRICDLACDYRMSPAVARKLEYCGYVRKPIGAQTIADVRAERGLRPGDAYVVCSAGGGMAGEALTVRCVELARCFEGTHFDIVLGPRSNLPWPRRTLSAYREGNVRFIRESYALPLLHAAADVVITPGGYNSLVESMQGRAQIIAVSAQARATGELFTHAARLGAYHPISLVKDPSELHGVFERVLARAREQRPVDLADVPLDFGGVEKIKAIIARDLVEHAS